MFSYSYFLNPRAPSKHCALQVLGTLYIDTLAYGSVVPAMVQYDVYGYCFAHSMSIPNTDALQRYVFIVISSTYREHPVDWEVDGFPDRQQVHERPDGRRDKTDDDHEQKPIGAR